MENKSEEICELCEHYVVIKQKSYIVAEDKKARNQFIDVRDFTEKSMTYRLKAGSLFWA